MRAAPLAFFRDANDPQFARTIRDVAAITHHNDEASAGAKAVIQSLQLLASTKMSRHDFLTQLTQDLPDTALSDRLVELPNDAGYLDAAERVGNSGRTAESVALAIFIGLSETTIEHAILAAIRAGGDTDTIAAIAARCEPLPAKRFLQRGFSTFRSQSASDLPRVCATRSNQLELATSLTINKIDVQRVDLSARSIKRAISNRVVDGRGPDRRRRVICDRGYPPVSQLP